MIFRILELCRSSTLIWFSTISSPIWLQECNILKFLFPVPRDESRRVMTFANHDDYISYRHHTYKKVEGGKSIELSEAGPRFQLRLYQIKLGTLDNEAAAETEWAL